MNDDDYLHQHEWFRNPDGFWEHPSVVSLEGYFTEEAVSIQRYKDGVDTPSVEIEERYCEIAARRLEQGVLFP